MHPTASATDTQAFDTISDHSWWFGESLDRLITVEMRSKNMAHGKIRPLYDAAIRKAALRSLSLGAAAALIDAVRPGDTVLMVTGAGPPPYLPQGENDGPVGAAVLARAIALGLGATPVYISEPHHVGPVIACSETAGIPIRPDGLAHPALGAYLDVSPEGVDLTDWSYDELERRAPSAVIFIEKLGSNAEGVVHNSTGLSDFSPFADLSPLAAEASRRGILTIGIGDAGNEIGCGIIFDEVREIQNFGAECRCPCGNGMATIAKTDYLLMCSVSNWGAYAIEAGLAHLLKKPDLMHGPVLQRRILNACLDAGGYEALYCSRADLVDAIAGDTSVSLAQILTEMVRMSLAVHDVGPVH